jgi:hypothetical protein
VKDGMGLHAWQVDLGTHMKTLHQLHALGLVEFEPVPSIGLPIGMVSI